MQAQLNAELFGHLRVRKDGHEVQLPASKKTRGLLGYLLASTRPRSRNELCDLFWEDAEDPRGALRWSLSKLRTTLGPELFASDRNTIAVNMNLIAVDLVSIEAAPALLQDGTTHDLEAVERLFRGEFLNGLELSDCYGFYEWCQAARTRYGTLNANVLKALIRRRESNPAQALEFAHKLVGLNPFDEGAHVKVVELLLALGRPDEARAQAAQCRKIFQLELGIEPSSSLDDAFRTAVVRATPGPAVEGTAPAGADAEPSIPAAAADFIGRTAERDLIRQAFARPDPRVVLIVGTPGIGKSALLAEI
ncbi:hypothetical protein HA397_24605, partial [Escherichia coli]|nr:hypothetical protein [Escherichia coli]